MSQLIALTGKMRAGKDTLAEVFIKAGYTRQAFADPLKDVVAYIADEPIGLYHHPEHKELVSEALGMPRREALQLMGTEGVRKIFGPDVWANRLIRRWLAAGKPRWIITDCRFDNEAEIVTANGGVVVEVFRPGQQGSGVKGHLSEAGVDSRHIDHVIVNDGTVDDLQTKGALLLFGMLEEVL